MAKELKEYVEPVKVGEVIKDVHLPNGTIEDATVHPKDQHKKGQWYCTTCKVWFENQFQKDGHIFNKKTIVHRLAWFCLESGHFEEP